MFERDAIALLRLFERGRHGIERVAELTELVNAAEVRPGRQIAAREPLRGGNQRADGPDDEELAADRRRGDTDHRNDREEPQRSLQHAIRLRECNRPLHAEAHIQAARHARQHRGADIQP